MLALVVGVAFPAGLRMVKSARRRSETYPLSQLRSKFCGMEPAWQLRRMYLDFGPVQTCLLPLDLDSRLELMSNTAWGLTVSRSNLAQPLTASDRTISPELPDQRRRLRPLSATTGYTLPALPFDHAEYIVTQSR